MTDIYTEIQAISHSDKDAAVCTVVNTHGSVPRKPGTKMIVYADGGISGTIGGGFLEKGVIRDALIVIQKHEPVLFHYDLLHQFNMCCGGRMEIFIEPIMKKNKLYIFGAGHTGKSLATIAKKLDFDIFLIDDRKEELDQITDPDINKMNLPYAQALPLLPFDTRTYIAIVTYSHELDRDILAFCMKKPYAYLGMIGSLRKVEITKKRFLDAGIAESEAFNQIDAPIGMEINAESPEEIAISILANMIKIKNTTLITK